MKKTASQIAIQVLKKLACESTTNCAVDKLLSNWQGLSKDKNESQFNSESLQKGMKVEVEHTKDKSLAKRISMDHLTEDPKYYDKLDKIEKAASRVLKKIAFGADLAEELLGSSLPEVRRNLTKFIAQSTDDIYNPLLAQALGSKKKSEKEPGLK